MNDTSDYDKHITEAVFRCRILSALRINIGSVFHKHISGAVFRCRTVSALRICIRRVLCIISI